MTSTAVGSAPSGHTVLAEADGSAYRSLLQRPVTRAERYALGKGLRERVPRKSLGDWAPPPDRPDPVDLIKDSPRGPGRAAGPGPGRPDGRLAVRVPARHRDRDGRGRRASCRPPASRRWSAATRTWATSASTPRPSATWSSTSTTSTRPTPAAGSGTCAGWWRASGSPAGRTARPRTQCGERGALVRRGLPRARCGELADQPLLARSFERLDVDRLAARRRPTSRCGRRSPRAASRARHRTSDRALPRFTEEVDGPAPDRRGAAADHPAARRRGRAGRRTALDEYLRHAAAALAPGARRLHARRRRAQGRRRRQRRAARLRRAAGGQQSPTTWCSCSSSRPAGRCWRATCTASRPGTRTRASGWWSTSRRCRPSATRCSAGPRSTAGSTTSASSAT